MTFGMIPCKCGNKPELEMHIVNDVAETTIKCPKCKRGVVCCNHFNGASIVQAVKMWNEYNVWDISTSVASME
jgi:hypothetical protein